MGNSCSCCKESGCFAWLKPKKPNLPRSEAPEPESRPKPVQPTLTENEVVPKPQAEGEESTPLTPNFLRITGWDFKVESNGTGHFTSRYDLMNKKEPTLVVRRGQSFTITLQTNRKMTESDKLSLIFTVADCKQPSFGHGTQVGMAVDGSDLGGWSARIVDDTEDSITINVTSSVQSVVGEWKLEADVRSGQQDNNFTCNKSFFILFNPWCAGDTVYVEGDDERNEYILNETGLIWRGTSKRLRPCSWNFAQFEENVLECILYVLKHVVKVSPSNMSDAIKVSRAISAGINSPDDNGVLVGNWTGEYEGGTSPTKWGGSELILQEYFKNKKPVKFGQCWVFSGVVTTACRALGIPCRSVTNFSSAHDTHNSLTIDYFFDDEGKVVERLNSDSIWNFHVWNEVWMTREDLGDEYNGWQAIDSTPQEESDGQYRCGPASLAAIKMGHIKKPYDIPFVFAEVNADKLFWKYRGPSQPMKLLGMKTEGVGQFVSTKAVGKFQREDVTHLYKHKEESSEERTVMTNALRMCDSYFARCYLNEELEDVEFDFQLIDDIVIGQPFKVCVNIHNKSDRDHDVEVRLRADTMLYTGITKDEVKRHKEELTLKPHAEEKVTLEVTYNDYYSKLLDQCAMNIACLAKVKETDHEYFAQDEFRCRKPDIKIEPTGDFKLGVETKCVAHFTNPLPVVLTKPRFIVQGAGMGKVQILRLKESIPVGGEARVEFVMTPTVIGERTITVLFDSRQLDDVDGFSSVEVQPAPQQDIPVNGDAAPTEVTTST